MSKRKNIRKIVIVVMISLLSAMLLFFLGTFIFHSIKSSKEIALLKEMGYYDPVSVGEYSLNVARFGNKNGKHTIVGLAGLGMGDYSVTARQMTACLEEDNYVVFVDRAGYGFSDDTDNELTLEYIVEDYRKALTNAGIQPPYILMPHSIGGAYANYWASNYPEEIEGIVFVDGSQLSADAFEEEPVTSVGAWDRFLAFLAKCGFSRYVLRDYLYHYPDNYSDEEQYLGDALTYLTLDSIAPTSESCLLAQNAQEAFNGIVTNDIPKLYICASWGMQSKEDIIETNRWINRQIEINDLDLEQRALDYDDETVNEILANYEKARQDIIYPYAEKMGNCEVVCLAGDHMIYQQRPQECGELIKSFVDGL
ncbi:MAG: alpha/beta hydrolase [Ruminococcaceae bacterium]|nr:alpha/beta hydrolase [Oscillospiraceae bacterium]